jgi:hypothetical protein
MLLNESGLCIENEIEQQAQMQKGEQLSSD